MIDAKAIPILRDCLPESALLGIEWRDGWPGLITVRLAVGTQVFSLFLAPITKHIRTRNRVRTDQPHEYRYQNPTASKQDEGSGKPIIVPPGTIPLFVGVYSDTDGTVFASTDPWPEVGRNTKHQVLVDMRLVRIAQRQGWAPPRFDRDEKRVDLLRADLMMPWLEAVAAGLQIGIEDVAPILDVAGVTEHRDDRAAERVRRGVMALVRKKGFGRKLSAAYMGRCAMCGLDLELVQGAHIYPVSALESHDALWNGLALCPNHHSAFDAHNILVVPRTRRIVVSPWMAKRAEGDPTAQIFIESLRTELAEPVERSSRPRDEMFERRYAFFAEFYDWASSFLG